MNKFVKNHLLEIVFSLAGALGGFLYWKFVGCESGTCMIKSVWYWSTLYGILVGYIAGGLVEEVVLRFKSKRK